MAVYLKKLLVNLPCVSVCTGSLIMEAIPPARGMSCPDSGSLYRPCRQLTENHATCDLVHTEHTRLNIRVAMFNEFQTDIVYIYVFIKLCSIAASLSQDLFLPFLRPSCLGIHTHFLYMYEGYINW